MSVILRRRKLGRTSCREISRMMSHQTMVVRNDKPIPNIYHEVLFRWGTTSNIPDNYHTIVNTAEAIHRVNDKTGFRRILNEHNLCPPTWFNVLELPEGGGPYVVRPKVHAQGRRLYVADNNFKANEAAYMCGEGYYISTLINKVAEYRVFVAQGRAVWVAQKTPGNPEDVAWNVARGGRFDNVRWDNWPLRVVKQAILAFNLSGLDFGGVDVMVDAEGNPYVLEINSAPSQTSPYRQSCVAKVFDYIIDNGKGTIPLVEERGGYKKFIHPAINEEAIIA